MPSVLKEVRVCDSCQSPVLPVSSLPNHGIANTRTYPTVFAKGLVIECQYKYATFCPTF